MPAVAAVNAEVPLPFTRPVIEVAPVPPLLTVSADARVTAPAPLTEKMLVITLDVKSYIFRPPVPPPFLLINRSSSPPPLV